MGVKSTKLASKTSSDSLKIVRLGLHDPPKSRPRTSRMPPRAFQMPPKPSKRCPKASKSLPPVQEPPRAPRSHAKASKSLQDASETTVQLTPTTDTRVLTKRLHLASAPGETGVTRTGVKKKLIADLRRQPFENGGFSSPAF